MKSPQMQELLTNMKKFQEKVDKVLAFGGIEKAYEVEPDSFVQLVEFRAREMMWFYHQYRLNTGPKEFQDKLVGLYLNEAIDDFKVVGIYRLTDLYPYGSPSK